MQEQEKVEAPVEFPKETIDKWSIEDLELFVKTLGHTFSRDLPDLSRTLAIHQQALAGLGQQIQINFSKVAKGSKLTPEQLQLMDKYKVLERVVACISIALAIAHINLIENPISDEDIEIQKTLNGEFEEEGADEEEAKSDIIIIPRKE